MQSLRTILKKFAKEYGIEGGIGLATIQKEWGNIVGKTIADHTYPDTIKNKILTITVDTPQWMHHLSFFKEEIISKLTPFNIESVRFKIGRVSQKPQNSPDRTVTELNDEDLRYLKNTIKGVKDDELREKFEKLIMHGLKKGKRKSRG